ncbi:copper homeostasis protein CutC [Pedobacter sp. Du54]|uniref:copper homeostasis protein CutC n=1 Tax=Pedobacter anseongensis TaxID=3133439 RepID=UPI003098CE5C
MELEVCANSFASALAAEQGGAVRVELCENMAEGGTTPSYATIKMATERLKIEVWPIIRPRGGDFLYTADEFELMKIDIQSCKDLGCNGVVFGILSPNGEIDKERCKLLLDTAYPLPAAFHRAFDMCNDLEKALEDVIDLGFARILSSGGAETALNGLEKLTKLVQLANDRIEIMPGSGINPQNIKFIKEKTGAKVFHASARIKMASKMHYRNKNAKMGSIEDEFAVEQTSEQLVKDLILALNA